MGWGMEGVRAWWDGQGLRRYDWDKRRWPTQCNKYFTQKWTATYWPTNYCMIPWWGTYTWHAWYMIVHSMHGCRLEQSVATTYKQLVLGTVYGNARWCLVSYCNRLVSHAKCYTMDNYVSRSTFSINSIKSLSNCVDTLIEIGRDCWMVW